MRALILTLLLTMPAAGWAAPAQDARCEITAGGQRIDGPCRFTPRPGGSFDVSMTDGRAIGGAGRVSLDLTGTGKGRLSGDGGRDWGTATRQPDGACWAADAITVCVRATTDATQAAAGGTTATGTTATNTAATRPPTDAERATSFGARCHMNACNWIIQSPAREIGQGSDAIPGRLVEVTQRRAFSEHRDDYPDHAPAGLDWLAPEPARFFCSKARPAVQDGDGWVVLPLPEVFGASEGATSQYLRACHPDRPIDDPYDSPAELGYTAGSGAGAAGDGAYPDFAALIRG